MLRLIQWNPSRQSERSAKKNYEDWVECKPSHTEDKSKVCIAPVKDGIVITCEARWISTSQVEQVITF